jgi:hypothetical protein
MMGAGQRIGRLLAEFDWGKMRRRGSAHEPTLTNGAPSHHRELDRRAYRSKTDPDHAPGWGAATDQRASPRNPPKRRAALVVSDFFAPLWTPTLFPPL